MKVMVQTDYCSLLPALIKWRDNNSLKAIRYSTTLEIRLTGVAGNEKQSELTT